MQPWLQASICTHFQTLKNASFMAILVENTCSKKQQYLKVQCSLAYKNRSFSIPPLQVSGRNSTLMNNFPLCTRIFFHGRLLIFCQKWQVVIIIKSIRIEEGTLQKKCCLILPGWLSSFKMPLSTKFFASICIKCCNQLNIMKCLMIWRFVYCQNKI